MTPDSLPLDAGVPPADRTIFGFPFQLPSTTRTRCGLLLALAGLLFLPTLGVQEIITADEAQRACPPREMLKTGDWVVPRIDGIEYLKKPPLLNWQVALTYRVLGISEWTARLPAALSGMALVVVVYLWVRRFSADSTALLAGVITSGNYLVLSKSRECQLDIPMALFTVAALWQWWKALQCLDRGKGGFTRAVFLGGLWLAIAHLYKFPIPFLFLICSWLGCIVALRRWRWLLRWPWWAALVASVIPVVLWGWAAAEAVGWERALTIWLREGALHVNEVSTINSGPFWFYVPRVILCFLPWSLLIPVLFLRGFRQAQSCRRLTFHYLWIGAGASFVLLSLNAAKETEYMLPAMLLFAILLAWAWEYWVTQGRGRSWSSRSRWRAIGGGIACYLVAAWFILPGREMYLSRLYTVQELGLRAQVAFDGGRPVAAYDMKTRPQFYYYLDRRIPEISTAVDASSFLRQNPNGILAVSHKKSKRLQLNRPIRVVAESGPALKLELVEVVTSPGLAFTHTLAQEKQ